MCEPEVGDLGPPFRVQRNIGCFDVAVGDPLFVYLLQTLCDLYSNAESLVERKWALGDLVVQGRAVNELQCDGGNPIVVSYLEDRRNVRVVQPGCSRRVTFEATLGVFACQ